MPVELICADEVLDLGLRDILVEDDLERFRSMTDEEISTRSGRGRHEIPVRTTAFACFHAIGPYETEPRYYHTIDQRIAGMRLATARLSGILRP
jgi:2,3-dihydroxyphenylpropionate 1,2-dioxygenase